MPRFFFDIYDGFDIRDEAGLECVNMHVARREAIKTAGEILRDRTDIWDGKSWKMQVRDETGSIVARLTFAASSSTTSSGGCS